MANKAKCIIWGTDAFYIKDDEAIKNDRDIIHSPRAGGKYIIDHITYLSIGRHPLNLDEQEKVRFSGWIAKQNLSGNTPYLDSLMEGVDIQWLEKLPPIPNNLDERSDLLLKGLAKQYPDEGKSINLDINLDSNQQDNPTPFLCALSYCSDSEDFQFLLFENLEKELKYIKTESSYVGGIMIIKITPKGWKRMKKIENKIQSEKSETAFIAMWIDSSVDNLKKSIETAIGNAGYNPLRIDDKEHNNKIDDEILNEIKRAKFMICDLTSEKEKPRGSVYFEAGYAMGKDIPIVWTCWKDLGEELPFDIRQYNCLFWEKDKLEDFAKKLQHRIENTVGKGPLKGV